MSPAPLLAPSAFVWLPRLDARRPEPPPPTGSQLRAFHLRRRTTPDEAVRTVLTEDGAGLAPLPHRIRLHGDPDEGWDWGWRGSAPLETALNILACVVHPKAAWRLHWAFCEDVLRPIAPAGGIISAATVRAWVHENRWLGRQRTCADDAESQPLLEDERDASRALSPAARAERIASLVTSVVCRNPGEAQEPARSLARAVGRTSGPRALVLPRRGAGSPGFQLLRAVATLNGAPPAERWPTVALLADRLPPVGSPGDIAWHRLAAPLTPGLPDPERVRRVADAWRPLASVPAPHRHAVVLDTLRANHGGDCPGWTSIPLLALALGADLGSGLEGEDHLRGDPLLAAAAIHAIRAAVATDAATREAATRLGLAPEVLRVQAELAHAAHMRDLRLVRRRIERTAAMEGDYALAAEGARLSRSRSHPPPPSSPALREWITTAPLDVLEHALSTAHGPCGAVSLPDALRRTGRDFQDPPGTIAQAIAWYLEERAPQRLDLHAFPGRCDGRV